MPRNLLPLLIAAILLPVGPLHAGSSEKTGSQPRFLLIWAGALLMAGGGALAYHQDKEADRDMAIYRKSAFTTHTEDYRDRVETHRRLTWAGMAGAALGGILIVVAF
jgi:LPXTG-motif cell wall-anchored protein